MMVKDPEQYLESWSNAGIRRFIGHVEQMPDQASFVARAQGFGEVGLALDSDTPLEAISVAYEDLDTVLIMMCKAGASGQEFQAGLLDKVRMLRQQSDFLPVEVDGGLSDKTIQEAMSAGAKRFVSTSYLFWQGNNIQAQYEKLQELISV
jgi:ribulose-phosphate 3-epimerase